MPTSNRRQRKLPSHSQPDHRDQKNQNEALLGHAVEIGREKFVDVIHQPAAGKIPVDMNVQPVAVWIHQASEQTSRSHCP